MQSNPTLNSCHAPGFQLSDALLLSHAWQLKVLDPPCEPDVLAVSLWNIEYLFVLLYPDTVRQWPGLGGAALIDCHCHSHPCRPRACCCTGAKHALAQGVPPRESGICGDCSIRRTPSGGPVSFAALLPKALHFLSVEEAVLANGGSVVSDLEERGHACCDPALRGMFTSSRVSASGGTWMSCCARTICLGAYVRTCAGRVSNITRTK